MPLETWRLLDLGPIPPLETQMIYDMIAQGITEGESENTLIICWPAKPLVSLGYFQEIEKDIDLEFCRNNDIFVTRRVIGGGGVYLDEGQMFYQLIGRIDSPTTPKSIDAYYKKFLDAPVQAYRNLGIDAYFRPVNDIQTLAGKKISGNGAGDVGDARILTGNIIFDFNFDMMVRVLKVPDEKFRDKVAQGLRQRMSTILLEKGELPDREEVKMDLLNQFRRAMDVEFERGELTKWEKDRMRELEPKYLSDEWLHWRSGGRLDARVVRLSATSTIGTSNYKAVGGLIRITIEDVEDRLNEIIISGDYFMLPYDAITKLEKGLIGTKTTGNDLLQKLQELYREIPVESPGITPEDLNTAIKMAIGDK